eukprot:scaffold68964_cov78-Cyclotella_meneghiniana.AAC.7
MERFKFKSVKVPQFLILALCTRQNAQQYNNQCKTMTTNNTKDGTATNNTTKMIGSLAIDSKTHSLSLGHLVLVCHPPPSAQPNINHQRRHDGEEALIVDSKELENSLAL